MSDDDALIASPELVARRVATGAAYLDKCEPGWWQRIDLDELNLNSPCRCILGQLAGDLGDEAGWNSIVWHFGLRRGDYTDAGPGTDVCHGFNAGGDQSGQEYDALTAEWARVIGERRAQVPA